LHYIALHCIALLYITGQEAAAQHPARRDDAADQGEFVMMAVRRVAPQSGSGVVVTTQRHRLVGLSRAADRGRAEQRQEDGAAPALLAQGNGNSE
jgi:hypothetical protein